MATAAHKIYCRLANGSTFRFQRYLRPEKQLLKCRQSFQSRNIVTAPVLYGTIKLDMPSLSPTMEQGNIIKWHKKEGDPVSPGDVLCEIETDKAVISMDTEEEGIFAKIIVPENTKNIKVGTLIALLVEEGDDWQNVEIPAGADKPATAPAESAASPSAPATSTQASTDAHGGSDLAGDGHLVGPSVKKLLQEYNIQASSLSASGPGGALLKGDVLDYIKANKLDKKVQEAPSPPLPQAASAPPPALPPPPAAAAGANYVDIPLTNMRRTIAKRLTESKMTIPHAYATIDSNVGAIADLRKTLQAEGIKVSVNDFIIKASAVALQRVPRVNAVWENDGLRLSPSVDISVAVATPNGLITPIVFGASYLSVDQIGNSVRELAGKAKEGKLQPHEYQGGSFSISNLGMFGISEFTAVINPPQVAIMAVGGSRSVASMSGNLSKMKVTLSYDSRAISEIEATRFLEEFRHVIEHPQSLLAGTNLDTAAEAFVF
ncbi:dihydrolipoamide acetyltransferase component of pyruvate dehydrogenase complex [Plakobranchus ocellatus]|uniref:Dihydrolipoamide acetyltransferase component of pyruvate dehydrogenase complex n=1 Tax=Plakobranchus ocellatus TaxID=259542 RepID=A0AAV4A314_9GAST|nr:dihydrolipoamide acetyltransferase component of pyruvate dehydrogenase complex [Plakobranchus ocellatus]